MEERDHVIAANQRKNLHGESNDAIGTFSRDDLKNVGRFANGSDRNRPRAETTKGGSEEVADAPGRLVWESDNNALSRGNQARHADLKEIEGKVLILGRKENAFGGTRRSGALQCHNPIDFRLRHTEELQGVIGQVGCCRKRKVLDIAERLQLRLCELREVALIERAVRTRIADHVSQVSELIRTDVLATQLCAA